ncbi:hypothetical protein [Priestia megaterium]|uniref:hypothetical protein n=1 Tax=Priestia megaterium TaxID=1404 RepID=UPI000BFBE50E|nr:hypothetical protein [Priestia megaterium]PGO60592.1 hypothetical protein CN981_08570 [Priestia megaterium]
MNLKEVMDKNKDQYWKYIMQTHMKAILFGYCTEHLTEQETLDSLMELFEQYAEKVYEEARIKDDEFKGLKIKNFFCNGFFGSDEYGLEDSIITSNTADSITVLKRDGEFAHAYIEEGRDMRELLHRWTTEKGYEE